MARVYFNENDQFAARWIGNIYPQATVDKRSISDVQGSDTNGFDRCHFFGGIAGWEYALQLAGWPEGRQVWTGSCPCQPFSICGKGEGEKDKRHLWPEFLRLIQEQRPPVVFGEQVASPDGRKWLAGVRADLESVGYTVGSADLCAAGVGAPHIRQRLYWVAFSDSERFDWWQDSPESAEQVDAIEVEAGRSAGGMVYGGSEGLEGYAWHGSQRNEPGWHGANPCGSVAKASTDGRLGNTDWTVVRPEPPAGMQSLHEEHSERGGLWDTPEQPRERQPGSIPGAEEKVGSQWELDGNLHLGSEHAGSGMGQRSRQADSFWGTADWIFCRDGKWRRVESGTFPLSSRVPARMGRIRGYGNSIVPQLAAKFIRASMEAISLNATT